MKELCRCHLCRDKSNDQLNANLKAAKAKAEVKSKIDAKATKANCAVEDRSGESAPLEAPFSHLENSYEIFLDPITYALMADPVVLNSDGNTYGRSTLDQHFKTQTKAMEEQMAGRQADETSCGAESQIQLTSPLTGEPTDGQMAPNRLVENQIVEIIEGGNLSLTTGELEVWHSARTEKSANDAARQEVEKNMKLQEEQRMEQARLANQRRAEELVTRVPGKDDVCLARHASIHDTGLACALCPPTFAQPQLLSSPLRCMLPGCARRFDSRAPGGARECCKRCCRSVCESCNDFGVTEFSYEEQAEGSVRPALAARDAALEEVCAECVVHLIEIVESGSAGPAGSAAHLTSKVCDWESRIMVRAMKHQELEVETQANKDFARKVRLEAQIIEREKELARLQATAQEASDKAEAARTDEGSNENELARVRKAEENAQQANVCVLQAEYQRLLDARNEVQDEDENGQLGLVVEISVVENRLELAQLELVTANEEIAKAAVTRESPQASKTPLSALYLEGSMVLLIWNIFRIAAWYFCFVLYSVIWFGLSSTWYVLRFTFVLLTMLMASRKDLTNDIGDDDGFMAHWGKRNAECALPLGLAYPTPAMLRRMESLRLRLAEARVAAKRATDARKDEECQRLTAALENLEDQVRAARARVSEAQDTAAAEICAASERRARRAAEEAERAQREAARRAEEREAKAARERHEADEHATRAAFSSMAGRDGGASVVGGIGDVRMCGRCKAGPIENKACPDLGAHNDYTRAGASRVNHCPNCDWFDAKWRNWPMWDGIPGPH